MEYVIRFLAGGLVVSLFAVAGDVLRPEKLRGLVRSSALRCAGNAHARVLEARGPLYGDGGPVDDHRRNRASGLQLSRLPAPDARAFLRADGDSCGNYRMACYCRRHQTGGVGVGDDCPRQGLGTQTRPLVRISRALRARWPRDSRGGFGGGYLGTSPRADCFWRFRPSSARAPPLSRNTSASGRKTRG